MNSGPAQNRVTPLGDIVAVAGRGAWMGNRGRLHEGRGTRVLVRNHQSKAWLTCALSFRGWRAEQWEPNHYTPLFFLDEAVAFAAGHRPCAECRRAAFNAYRDAWPAPSGTPYARELDAVLHTQRRTGRDPAPMSWRGLPDGVFVASDDGPAVVVAEHLSVWAPDNSYGRRLPRPRRGTAAVITPTASVDVLRAGYPVQIDDAAQDR